VFEDERILVKIDDFSSFFAAIKDRDGQGLSCDWFSVSDCKWVAIRVSFAETSGSEKGKTLSGGIGYG
jgi:hypothetical protein